VSLLRGQEKIFLEKDWNSSKALQPDAYLDQVLFAREAWIKRLVWSCAPGTLLRAWMNAPPPERMVLKKELFLPDEYLCLLAPEGT